MQSAIEPIPSDEADPAQVAAQVHANVAHYRALLDNAPFGAYLVNADFRLVLVNRAARPAFGDIPDLEGRPFDEVLRRIWPMPDAEIFIERFRGVLSSGEPYVESEYAGERHDNGAHERYALRVERIPLERGHGVVCYFREVTREAADRAALARLSEESERWRRLYDTVLSNTPDLAYVFDLDHRFVYANAALLRMWGRSWEESIGRNCLELGYEPWHAAMHDREIEQVVATRQPIRGVVPFDGANGRRIYDYIFVPVIGPDGEVECVAGSTRDVTEQRQAADDLAALAESLAEADRRKGEFLALLAHELRNPLAPIVNAVQIMRMTNGEGPLTRHAFQVLERQAAQLVRLVDDLLDVNRISRGKIELRRERIDIAAPVAMAIEATRPVAEARGQRITASFNAGHLVDADPARLVQVVGNLLTNACKFSPEGSDVALQLTVDGSHAVVRVLDRGVGIAPEQLPRIFEMFAQVDEPLVRANGGLGIGLALVRGLVDLHGGSVTAHSAGLGQGSEFVVRLPLPGR